MNYIATQEQLDELVDYYSQQDAFCFDVETVGENRLDTRRNRVMWIALSTHGRADVIPMGHPHGEFVRYDYTLKPSGLARIEKGLAPRKADYSTDKRKAKAIWTPAPEQLTPAEVFRGLEPLMFSDMTKVGHNLKFDLESVAKYYKGRVPTPKYFDTMVAAYLLFSTHRPQKAPYNKPYSLASVLHRELGVEMEKGVGKEIEIHAFSVARKYTVLDGKWDWLLYKELKDKLAATDMMTDLMALEMDVLEVLTSMETEPAGAPVDMDTLRQLDEELGDRLIDIKSQIFAAVGKEFNLNSTAEIQDLLFLPKKDGGQGLRPWKLTDSARARKKSTPGYKPVIRDYSTDKESLEGFEGNPVVDLLVQHAVVDKLHGTYIKSYLKDSPALGGKIFADFKQVGTETGRFSCAAPNLQNVPRPGTELGTKIRGLFIANTSKDPVQSRLVVADYSQIEPRIIAALSQDAVMLDAYLNGKDIYSELAIPLGLDRQAGKTGILAMSYGVGPEKFSSQMGVPQDEGEEILSKMQKRFSGMTRYQKKVVDEAKRRRPAHVVTLKGRRRYLPELFSDNYGVKLKAERQAFNTMIQGSAADIIKHAMVRLYKSLKDEIPEARILLQVHDELVTKCPVNKTDLCQEIVRDAMEGFSMISVPLVADIKVVDRWSEAK